VFGDSQSKSYFPLTNSVVRELPGITMHRVGRDNAWFMRKIKRRLGRRSVLVFVFGGVDARIHIGRIAEQESQSVESVVNDLVNRYLTAVSTYQGGRRVLILGVLPPGSTEEIGHRSRPTWSTQEARARIVVLLNRALREGCERRQFRFVDVGAKYADERGFMPLGITVDGIHLRPEHVGPALNLVTETVASI
jgi:hypothetical protein